MVVGAKMAAAMVGVAMAEEMAAAMVAAAMAAV